MTRQELTRAIIHTAYLNQDGHIASALSILDSLLCLYDHILTDEDMFVLSKGHGCLGLYATFLHKRMITEEEFYSFCQFNSKLGGHPSSRKIPDIVFSAGSLGHGLPFAAGVALGHKIHGVSGQVYCLIGDGEANEGTTWESALIASTYKLDNLVCLMDCNGSGERAIKLNPCVGKFYEFGWDAVEVDGHNTNSMVSTLTLPHDNPLFVQLNTIKGKGCPAMENNPEWHHKWPTTVEQYEKIILSIPDEPVHT